MRITARLCRFFLRCLRSFSDGTTVVLGSGGSAIMDHADHRDDGPITRVPMLALILKFIQRERERESNVFLKEQNQIVPFSYHGYGDRAPHEHVRHTDLR